VECGIEMYIDLAYFVFRTRSVAINATNIQDYKSELHFKYLSSANGKIRRCMTYDPPASTKVGPTHNVSEIYITSLYNDNYILQKLEIKLNLTDESVWMVTLHNKNNLVPGTGKLYGSAFVTSNTPRFRGNPLRSELSVYELLLTDSFCIDEDEARCEHGSSSDDVDWNICFARFIETILNCTMPWRSLEGRNDIILSPCNNAKQYKRLTKVLGDIELMGQSEISEATGCLPGCKRREYAKSLIYVRTIPLHDNSSVAVVRFFYASTQYTEKRHYLVFDTGSLLASIGSFLGLFLGYNCRLLTISVFSMLKRIMIPAPRTR
jgi:hypothetical protein